MNNSLYFYSRDGITVTVILDTRRALANGNYPVKTRVTYHRTHVYYPTGKNLSQEDWQRLGTTRLRALLAVRRDVESSFNLVREAVEELADRGGFSFGLLDTRIKGCGTKTILDVISTREQEQRKAGRISTADIFRALLRAMREFSTRTLQYQDISPSWLMRFEDFMRVQGKSQTTIAIYLRALRGIFNRAKADGIIKEMQYPFGQGRFVIQEGSGRKMALSIKQIGAIVKFDDGKESTAKYRDYWLFLYLCNGLNVADFVNLRYRDIQNGELCYVRQKTRHRTKSLRPIRAIVVPLMQEIIRKWGNEPAPNNFIFPILDGTETAVQLKTKTKTLTRSINRRMEKIADALGIGHISTYTARHSFATVLKRAGANIAYISESLGHSDIKTTENYLASFEREEREKNAKLLTRF